MDFNTRLEEFLKTYDLTAASLAEEIDINRSTISHLLSGRNKPSLDLIMKLHQRFPDVSLEWWVYGDGKIEASPLSSAERKINSDAHHDLPKGKTESAQKIIVPSSSNEHKKIERVILFYSDGTFSDYRTA